MAFVKFQAGLIVALLAVASPCVTFAQAVAETSKSVSATNSVPIGAVGSKAETEIRQRDFDDLKQRLLALIASFDRAKTTQADIEAIMGVAFAPDTAEAHFPWSNSSNRKISKNFKGLNIDQHVHSDSKLFVQDDAAEPKLPNSITYGIDLELLSFARVPGTCLTIKNFKASLPSTMRWAPVSRGVYYAGIGAELKGGTVYAFVGKDTFYMTPVDGDELARLTKKLDDEGSALMAKSARSKLDEKDGAAYRDILFKLQAQKAKFDGCIILLGIQ